MWLAGPGPPPDSTHKEPSSRACRSRDLDTRLRRREHLGSGANNRAQGAVFVVRGADRESCRDSPCRTLGMDSPTQAAFDGQRILVTDASGYGVSLWNAADLSPSDRFSWTPVWSLQ